MEVQPKASAPFAVGAQSITVNGRLQGLNRDRVAPLATALAAVFAAPKDDKAARRAGLHQLVEALRDSVRSGRLDEAAHAVRVSGSGVQAGAETVHLSLAGDAPGDVLQSSIELEIAGLDAGSAPPTFAAWLPRRLTLRPTLSGVGVADLTRLALLATEPKPVDRQELDGAIGRLFAGPGMTIGIDPLVIELPAARLDGSGHVVLHSFDRYDGQARISLTGFDALLAQASHDPALKQAVPAMLMARGLARPEEDRLVWDIVSDGKVLTINGVDASSLLGAGAPGGAPGRGAPPARPQPGPSR